MKVFFTLRTIVTIGLFSSHSLFMAKNNVPIILSTGFINYKNFFSTVTGNFKDIKIGQIRMEENSRFQLKGLYVNKNLGVSLIKEDLNIVQSSLFSISILFAGNRSAKTKQINNSHNIL
jgi:hypothetical protein